MKILSILLLSCGFLLAQNFNVRGLRDTSRIDGFENTELHFSKSFPLSEHEDMRIILKVDDTDLNGFANDSLQIEWGYQTFSLCLDTNTILSTGRKTQIDTCFDVRIALDTLRNDSLGRIDNPPSIGSSNADGTFTRPLGLIDTLGVDGYATQTRWFTPEWDEFIRFWVQGLTGNSQTLGSVKTVFDYKRRLYVNVRQK